MKIKFNKYQYQLDAVHAVVDCFKGQPYIDNIQYMVDPGITPKGRTLKIQQMGVEDGFRNAPLLLDDNELLENIHEVQRRQGLKLSPQLVSTPQARVNLDVEMETGTGKTYVYIRTIYELNQKYGWSKFIIIVPSVAIREGIKKSFEMTQEHFLQEFQQSAKFFIYDSNQLNEVESFSTDAGINVMIMNHQAFSARKRLRKNDRTNRKIYEVRDDFSSRRPIDVIRANNPILILDEPQKLEGAATLDALQEFKASIILRYSATHKTQNNLIYRLDAVDAYNQRLVKRIAVRGITINNHGGTHGYLYLEEVEVSKSAPVARVLMEVKSKNGVIRRVMRKIEKGDNLYELSNEMEQYKEGYLVTNIVGGPQQFIEFENGLILTVGTAVGDISEEELRRIQIRETIRAHFEKEATLFKRGIKALSLFFIDEVVKYRDYDQEDTKGEYARIFEEEYKELRDQYLAQITLDEEEAKYHDYLMSSKVDKVHRGYFSIDRQNRQVDPKERGESRDANDYDLILKDKERLLSFEEPTRFIFSHSALREGWDNPNVFTLCTLKHSDNTISRRQEIGRGLRISVNQEGIRQDESSGLTKDQIHEINVLDVIASESYENFARGLQKEISEELKSRPRKVSAEFFIDRSIIDNKGNVTVIDSSLAEDIMYYLTINGYLERDRTISDTYRIARENQTLVLMEGTLAGKDEAVFELIDRLAVGASVPLEDSRKGVHNQIIATNLARKEFQELWQRINRKAVYQVSINEQQLIENSIEAINERLRVRVLEYEIRKGLQKDMITDGDVARGSYLQSAEVRRERANHQVASTVKYDLLGKVAEEAQLTRTTIAKILSEIEPSVFAQYKHNPEDFITQAAVLINEQKARIIINQVTYNPLDEHYDTGLFTDAQLRVNQEYANGPLEKHILKYALTDSKVEQDFITELENNEEVIVYAKLPSGFKIPTPVGDYNPDWAISFKEGEVKHVYFVAETKGTTSTMEIRGVEQAKIECAKRFFNSINPDDPSIAYGVVSNYSELLDIIREPN